MQVFLFGVIRYATTIPYYYPGTSPYATLSLIKLIDPCPGRKV